MCGIAGIVGPIDQRHRDALRRMTDALAHRGPDGEGHLEFQGCALGHRRLAIVDLATGTQPMLGADRRIAVTFNGEIYGYRELRRRLDDYPFQTQSDTEVILALYQRHGDQLLTHLPGMFAFAIWDDVRQELIAGRDRFGEKPFYYSVGRGGEFVFASEIKGVLASGLVDPVIDRRAMARYLQRQCVRMGESIYSNIKALPPSHLLRLRHGRIELTRYWSIPATLSDIGADDAVEQFRALLQAAVQRQLVADVPVGALLSGGLDSTTICKVASGMASDLRTFCFDFEGAYSELAYARATADAYRTRHVELSAHGVDIAAGTLRMQGVYDEPFGDPSALPTFLIAGEAALHTKVVLTGDGGDELFGGYAWYQPLLWMLRLGKVGFLRWTAARILNRTLRMTGVPGAAARELRIMGMAYGRNYSTPLAAHRAQMEIFGRDDLADLQVVDGRYDRSDEGGTEGSFDDVIRFDIEDYMAPDILTKIDRASMAHGLELRAPFLDVEFASFCLSLPYRLKVSTQQDKLILRKAFEEQWPPAIRTRTKQGFGAPLGRWFRDPGVRALETRFVKDPGAPIFGFLSYPATQAILTRGNVLQRWTLLILGIWLAQAKGGKLDEGRGLADSRAASAGESRGERPYIRSEPSMRGPWVGAQAP